MNTDIFLKMSYTCLRLTTYESELFRLVLIILLVSVSYLTLLIFNSKLDISLERVNLLDSTNRYREGYECFTNSLHYYYR